MTVLTNCLDEDKRQEAAAEISASVLHYGLL